MWHTKTISEICDVFTDGNWIEKKDQSEEGIRLIQTGNVGEGEFKDRADKARYINEETFLRLKCTEIHSGDCLISRLPDPVGRACIIPEINQKLITAVDCSILRFKSNYIYPDFFKYFSLCRDYLRDVEHQCSGATRKRISRKNLGKIQIPLPPLEEQKRIVAILDEAFAGIDKAIENTEKNIQNAKDLFESYLNNIFTLKGEGWVEGTLGEIAEVGYGFTDKSIVDGDYRYVRITDIDNYGELTSSNKKYIKSSLEAEKFVLKNNDLLMARTGATFAKVLLYKDIEPSIFASYLIKISFTAPIENELYWFFSKTPFYWDQANSLSSGAAQPHFNGAALKQVKFPYPTSADEQINLVRSFRHMFDETQKIKIIYQQKLASLKELKQSLLQKAFSGELTSDMSEVA